mgnify:CR=1 FL=1
MAYRQVELWHENSGVDSGGKVTITIQRVYIPDEFSKIGKYLEIENKLWKVIDRSTKTVDTVPDTQKLIRLHRKNTGDALPKRREEEDY